ncbi:protein LIAT1 [Crotalus tigris]|uniref:protein LIAT1 n=1 Tax=Crotalus tigris TaxID=88082 RepID=UPI00192FB54B|nr:protein LIAT1 [Crotalus tigris]XP_039177189.1 protein LIAT1 [Crotalus tigris]XP_039177190.1 protein LIAT1 [Crotalus tigris]
METGRQDAMSDGEGAKGSKLAAKLPPTPVKEKASKKKKKKNKVPGHDNHSSQVKKKSIFAIFPLDLLQRWKCDGAPQEGHSKRGSGKATRNSLLACSSATSVSTPGEASLPNESLRWDGVLEDPKAEEERLYNYRLSRRKRYGEFLQQNPLLGSPFPCQQLPGLDKVTEAEKERSLHNSHSSSLMAKTKRRPNSKQGSKTSKRQPTALPSSKSQGGL